eukprot:7324387-Pyramimonas_sp.AAC.1
MGRSPTSGDSPGTRASRPLSKCSRSGPSAGTAAERSSLQPLKAEVPYTNSTRSNARLEMKCYGQERGGRSSVEL